MASTRSSQVRGLLRGACWSGKAARPRRQSGRRQRVGRLRVPVLVVVVAVMASTVVVPAGAASAAAPQGPTAYSDQANCRNSQPVTLDLLANDVPGDAPIDPSSLRFFGNGAYTTTTFPSTDNGFGIFTAGPGAGEITYTPTTYNGPVTLLYRVSDVNGLTSGPAWVMIDVRLGLFAKADNATTAQGTPITVYSSALANRGSLFPSLTLLDPNGEPVTTVNTAQGTYIVGSGGVTFTPVPTFTGVAPPVRYRLTDVYGQTAQSTITITVTATTPPVQTTTPAPPTTQPAPTTIAPPPTSSPVPPTTTPAPTTKPHRTNWLTRWFTMLFNLILQDLARILHPRPGRS